MMMMMMSPGDLVKVAASVDIHAVSVHDAAVVVVVGGGAGGRNGASCLVTVVQMGPVEEAGIIISIRTGLRHGGVGVVHPVVHPLCVPQQPGRLQSRVQGEEGLDQGGLRLWMEGRAGKKGLQQLTPVPFTCTNITGLSA